MKGIMMLGLLAETSIHPGAGQSMGAIDNPVAREKTTGYPVLAASGVKGALRDRAVRDGVGVPVLDEVYGKADRGGALIVGDGRLLLLPVRSLTSAYRWVTCPHLIERLQRDRALVGIGRREKLDFPSFDASDGLPGVVTAEAGDRLFLEEQVFKVVPNETLIETLVGLVGPLIGDDGARGRLKGQLAIVGDDAFAEIARCALPVDAHNSLTENKISKALWYEESIPPDTVMYVPVLAQESGTDIAGHLDSLFFDSGKRPYLQVGGNETTGQGWFRLAKEAAP